MQQVMISQRIPATLFKGKCVPSRHTADAFNPLALCPSSSKEDRAVLDLESNHAMHQELLELQPAYVTHGAH